MNLHCRKWRQLIPVLLASSLIASAFSAFAQTATNAPAPPQEEKKPAWDTSAAVGVTLTRGNSQTLLVTGNILGDRKWDHDKNELRLGADATYGEDHNVKNAESEHGFGQYNRLFTERFYGYARVDALHDAIADVQYRVTLAPGVGYYIIKTTNTTFSAEFGPGYIFEEQGHHTHNYATLRFAERLEHKINDHVRLWESVEYLPEVDKFSNYIVNSEVGVDTTLTKKLSLKVFAQDTYHSEPAPDRQKNDLKMVTAIAYHF
jgi:putative salt-induced outer membrane protein YdiY